jgi:hypothetical protein
MNPRKNSNKINGHLRGLVLMYVLEIEMMIALGNLITNLSESNLFVQ